MNISEFSYKQIAIGNILTLSGSFDSLGQSLSFPVDAGALDVTIYGTFVGSVQLERSFDNLVWHQITASGVQLYTWSSPASEMAEEPCPGTMYRLRCTSFVSGVISYRVDQFK